MVYAHPERRSYNASLHTLAVETLRASGHEVIISDLYEMHFEPVASRRDFLRQDLSLPTRFREEQRIATEQGALTVDIVKEQEHLKWCDLLILQFPLWWFSMPAIMKGWIDRVFTPGFAYSRTGFYNQGGLQGKKALILLTTGSSQVQYSSRGLNGPIEAILFPIHHGILGYVGFEVLPPFVAWQPSRVSEEQRKEIMDRLGCYLNNLDALAPLVFPIMEDADENYHLFQEFDWGLPFLQKIEDKRSNDITTG